MISADRKCTWWGLLWTRTLLAAGGHSKTSEECFSVQECSHFITQSYGMELIFVGTYGTFDVPVNEGSLATFWWNVLLTLINCLLEHTRHYAFCAEWQKRTEVERSVGIPLNSFFFCTHPLTSVCFIFSALFSTAVCVFSASSLSIASHEHSRANISCNEVCCSEFNANDKTCYFILLYITLKH